MKLPPLKTVIVAVVFLLVGAGIVKLLPVSDGNSSIKHEPAVKTPQAAATIWTCSMHPQIRMNKPGKCPICFMDLIPLKTKSGDNANSASLQLSPQAAKLAEVETAPVERKFVPKTIRMVGMVALDETKLAYITARIPGRIDVLYINYTGIAVRKGDHMAGYYSPELYVGQKELLQSLKAIKQQEYSGDKREEAYPVRIKEEVDNRDIMKSVITRLKLWGLTDGNINSIIKEGKVVDLVTLYAPISGIVIHKNAVEGMYFKTGDRLFTIADLSSVWIELEAYESDIAWLRYGQKVEFTTESYPGEKFEGRISFIDPFLDPKTRTVRIRVNAPNLDGKLKPDMFVSAVVYAKVSHGGKVIDPYLADKWISPMHPEIIKDKPGKCDICGMPLVKASTLGYGTPSKKEAPLVVPASAPLVTGKRAVVYVNDKPGHYYGQEVTLGSRVGDYYVVEKGLKAGEMVVTNGNFKIDSALQIQARPSMMGDAPPNRPAQDQPKQNTGSTDKPKKLSAMFSKGLKQLYSEYFSIQSALSNDKLADARKAAKLLSESLKMVHGMGMAENAVKQWHQQKASINSALELISQSNDLNKAREQFSVLSESVYKVLKTFGGDGKAIYRFHCPMAFDNKGAYWLQDNSETRNPYFGQVMLKCGDKVEEVKK